MFCTQSPKQHLNKENLYQQGFGYSVRGTQQFKKDFNSIFGKKDSGKGKFNYL